MGTAATSAGAAGPSEGLRARWSSGRTKPEYPAASGRHDHATFGSGPTRQSNYRDSQPHYLLRLTRHGPGGILSDNSVSLFRLESLHSNWDSSSSNEKPHNVNFSAKIRYFCIGNKYW